MAITLRISGVTFLFIAFFINALQSAHACAISSVYYLVFEDTDWDSRPLKQMLKKDYSLEKWENHTPIKLKVPARKTPQGNFVEGTIISFEFSLPKLNDNENIKSVRVYTES